jgi:hypothetical protein
MIPNTTEAAVSRVDLPKMKKVRNATIVANRTNHNCAGSGQVSIGRIIFVSGSITSRYSANSMNFAVGWAAVVRTANSPKEMPPGVPTYAKALRTQLDKYNDNKY